MKYMIGLLLTYVAIISCDQQVGYQITGEVSNADSDILYLKELNINKSTIIDTATIDDNGKFEFNGIIENPGLFQINADKKQGVIVYLNPKSKLSLDMDFSDLETYEVDGNVESSELKEFRTFLIERGKEQAEMIQSFQQETDEQKRLMIQQEVSDFGQETQKMAREKIQNSSSAYVGIGHLMLSGLRPNQNRDLFNQFAERIQVEIPNSQYTKDFQGIVDQLNAKKPALTVGDTAPEISLETPNGQIMSLSDVRGKYVLLDFWAAWCGPCRRENPNVVKAYNKYKDKGFVVFNVSLDKDKNKWVRAIEQDNLDWPYHVSDLKFWNSQAAKDYGIRSIPASYLLDPNGQIIATNLRGPALERKLKEVLM